MTSAGTAQDFTITKTPSGAANAAQTQGPWAFAFSAPVEPLQNLNRNRFYRPDLGRFLSADKMNDSHYVYVGNDPIAYIDPNGWTAAGIGFTTYCENRYRYTGRLSIGLDCNTSANYIHPNLCQQMADPLRNTCYTEIFWDLAANTSDPNGAANFDMQFKKACDKAQGVYNCIPLNVGGYSCSCCMKHDCCPTPPPSPPK